MFKNIIPRSLLLIFPTLLFSANSFSQQNREWTDTFFEDSASFSSRGSNPYFTLEPGYYILLTGKEKNKDIEVLITVLDETKIVDGVETRVVEERESVNGTLIEVSRNFFAISKVTNNVYYFGEDVEIYKDGELESREGEWRSGKDGARYGLIMPGSPLLGARYYQEIAPGNAMDRAEIVSLNASVETNSGTLKDCLKTEETNPLEPKEKEYKYYARNIGLVWDEGLTLTKYGFENK